MTPEEIFETVKAVFSTFSESAKFLKSRKCRKLIENFLKSFDHLATQINLIPENNIENFLNLLNGIMQAINATLISNICH